MGRPSESGHRFPGLATMLAIVLGALAMGCRHGGPSEPWAAPPSSSPAPPSAPSPARPQSDEPFWIAVSRDGGRSFAAVTRNGALGREYVDDLAITPAGTIYVLGTGGVLRSTDGGRSFQTLRRRSDLANPDFNAIAIDAAGVLYVGTNRGLWISRDQAKSFREVTTADGLGSDQVRGVYVGPPGHLYAATDSGVSISTDDGRRFTNVLLGPPGSNHNVVYDVYADDRGALYAVAWFGLSISSGREVRFGAPTCCDGYGIGAVEFDRSGRVYVASDIGLFVSSDRGKTFTARSLRGGSNPESIKDVAVGPTGTIYAATPTGLWISTDGTTFSNTTANDGLPADTIDRLFTDDAGNLYAAHWLPPYSDMED